jgi:hypothetical protein
MLILLLAGFFAGWLLAFRYGWPGWLLMAGGVVGLLTLLRRARGRQPTRYRPIPWRLQDVLLLTIAATPLLVTFLPGSPHGPSAAYYSPYPRLGVPSFTPWSGAAVLLLALPAAMCLLISPSRDPN